jgi:hypothetical protein
VIGSIRHECLDHEIIFDERHLRCVLREYLYYCHRCRTHLELEKDCPVPREVEPVEIGPIRSEPVLGGLHHRYFRRAGATLRWPAQNTRNETDGVSGGTKYSS